MAAGCAGADGEPADAGRSVVWVANEGSDSLTVLDARTGAALSTLTGVDGPHNVQASDAGDRVWVTGTGGVIEVGSESLAVQHVAPAGDHPAHVVAGPDGVLVTSYGDGTLHDYTEALEPRQSHPLGGGPHGMRVAPDGSFVAVANNVAGTLDIVDLPLDHTDHTDHTGQTGGTDTGGTRSVDVGPQPVQVAVSPDSSTVFVSVAGSRSVVRVDVATGRVTGEATVEAAPAQVWVTGTGLVLSANQGTEDDPGSTLGVIDADTMEVLAEVRTGVGPHGVVVTEDDSSAWVTNTFEDTVSVVDLEALETVATYAVGDRPNGITLGRSSVQGAAAQTPLLMPAPYGTVGESAGGATGHHEHDDEHGDEHEQDDQGHDRGHDQGSASDHH
jgi:DNA-binding beta-propeller fold protein YncE